MFRHQKLYVRQKIDPFEVEKALVALGYKKRQACQVEGEFSRKGDAIDIFPHTFELPVRILWAYDSIERIATFHPEQLNLLWDYEMIVVLPEAQHIKRKDILSIRPEEFPSYNFFEFVEGDYVVHTEYGIALYRGIKNVEFKHGRKDALCLEFADGKILYVPIEESHLVQRYFGFDPRVKIRLSALDSNEWRRLKEKVKRGIYNMAGELLKVQAARKSKKGFSFRPDRDMEKEFEKSFEYDLTQDQKTAIEATLADMEKDSPMDRLICGEVGFGKTEVAMRAAFRAALNGKQTAILVPTTLLAEQHFYNFTTRFARFPIKVEMLSRFKTKSQQKEIIEGAASGQVDVLIGTHRLLSGDIRFKDLGLLIIDEEQRFGVAHKERIKRLRTQVDILTMTATPIPRTLYMSLMGIKDISAINTPPAKRLAVQTRVLRFGRDVIRQAIDREISRGGQVFYLHNRVETIEKRAEWLKKLVDCRIEIAHGQMPASQLEAIMIKFIKGEISVLVCTTIIESGIDIPNANTLIVEDADMFGLAELHQLRGRVGRAERQGYAYFLTKDYALLNQDARKRLIAIERYSELGSGFHIAMEDMQIRGAGNILGTEQHGYIAAVGFDLYCRLLREAVEEMKNNDINTDSR